MNRCISLLASASIVAILLAGCSGAQKGKSGLELKDSSVELGSRPSASMLFKVPDGDQLKIIETDYNAFQLGDYTVKATTQSHPDVVDIFHVKVADKTPPRVTAKGSSIILPVGEDVNWMDYVDLQDNSFTTDGSVNKESIDFSVNEDNLDINTKGDYTVSYTAIDQSGNKTTGTLSVKVDDPWEDYEIYAAKLLDQLKNQLKNPGSLQVYSITCRTASEFDSYHFKIDASAQNGFGGTNRSTYYLATKDGTIGQHDFDESIMLLENITYNQNDGEQYSLDVAKITNAPDYIKK